MKTNLIFFVYFFTVSCAVKREYQYYMEEKIFSSQILINALTSYKRKHSVYPDVISEKTLNLYSFDLIYNETNKYDKISDNKSIPQYQTYGNNQNYTLLIKFNNVHDLSNLVQRKEVFAIYFSNKQDKERCSSFANKKIKPLDGWSFYSVDAEYLMSNCILIQSY